MATYGIMDYYTIAGKEEPCLCTRETESGGACLCGTIEEATKRVEELHAAGYPRAYYEEIPRENQWWRDENWIG